VKLFFIRLHFSYDTVFKHNYLKLKEKHSEECYSYFTSNLLRRPIQIHLRKVKVTINTFFFLYMKISYNCNFMTILKRCIYKNSLNTQLQQK